MQSQIYQYIKNENGHRIGLVTACKFTYPDENTRVGIGWSKCAVSKGDKFDIGRAFQIARGRANNGTGPNVFIPDDVDVVVKKMLDRAKRYFKTNNITVY